MSSFGNMYAVQIKWVGGYPLPSHGMSRGYWYACSEPVDIWKHKSMCCQQ